jgi:hypothetical protein
VRNTLGIFGMVAGAVVVTMTARYGYLGSDTLADGAIAAFFFAVIAVGGIAGPAVAVHLFRSATGWARLWGVLAGIVAAAALAANLSNSLGSLAGRAEKTLAERARVADARKDDRGELARILAERQALPAFTPATAETVAAAKRAADTATKNREAECEKRGPNCRQREIDEQAAADKLTTATTNKATTDRAAKLEADAAAIRKRLDTTPPVASVNPLAETLGRIFALPAETAATAQQVAMVVVVELLIAFALVAWELLAHPAAPTASPTAGASRGETETPEPEDGRPEPNLAAGNVVALDSARPAGDPAEFALACLEPSSGASVVIEDLHQPYGAWCRAAGRRPLDQAEFAGRFTALLGFAGMRTEKRGGRVLVRNVRLVA